MCSLRRVLAPFVQRRHLGTSCEALKGKSVDPPNAYFETAHKKEKIEGVLDTLYHYGFTSKQIDEILNGWPSITQVKTGALKEAIEGWLTCRLGEESTKALLSSCPPLLSFPPNKAWDVCDSLTRFFHKDDLKELLALSPNVVSDNPSLTRRKIEYLLEEMGVGKRQAVKSGALRHTLDHIRLRHRFLLKAGLYKPKSKQATNNNPPLTDILNTTDSQFCSKTKVLSINEFDVFKELFQEEDDSQSD